MIVLHDMTRELTVEARPDDRNLHIALYGIHRTLHWSYKFRLERADALALADWIRVTLAEPSTVYDTDFIPGLSPDSIVLPPEYIDSGLPPATPERTE